MLFFLSCNDDLHALKMNLQSWYKSDSYCPISSPAWSSQPWLSNWLHIICYRLNNMRCTLVGIVCENKSHNFSNKSQRNFGTQNLWKLLLNSWQLYFRQYILYYLSVCNEIILLEPKPPVKDTERTPVRNVPAKSNFQVIPIRVPNMWGEKPPDDSSPQPFTSQPFISSQLGFQTSGGRNKPPCCMLCKLLTAEFMYIKMWF